MKGKKIIKKLVFATAWFIIAAGMMILLIAANGKEAGHVCKNILITIKGVGESFYIDKNDISESLQESANGNLLKRPLHEIDLNELEKGLKKNQWIADAELFFDSQNILHVIIIERQPIARVFTTAGSSFYIDTAAIRMPLLQKVSVRLPVVTNFPAAKKLNKKDSALLEEVKLLTQFITKHAFWNAQIAQIDIVNRKHFELVPTIGNHIIKIGTAENLEQKFHRLFVFYRQVVSKVGFNKYSTLDVQYEDQVVAAYKDYSSIDSLQLQKNIEELLKKNLLQQEEAERKNWGQLTKPSVSYSSSDSLQENRVIPTPITTSKSNVIETKNLKITNVKANKSSSSSVNVRKPKAVMPKRVH